MPLFFSALSYAFQAPCSSSRNHAETIERRGEIKHLPRQSRFELVVAAEAVFNAVIFFDSVLGFVSILLVFFCSLSSYCRAIFVSVQSVILCVCIGGRFVCPTIGKIILLDTYPFFLARATKLSKLIFFHIPKEVQEIFDLNNIHTFQWDFLLCHWCFISYSFSLDFFFSSPLASFLCWLVLFGSPFGKSDFRHLFYYSMLVCHIKSELSCETKQECIKITFENAMAATHAPIPNLLSQYKANAEVNRKRAITKPKTRKGKKSERQCQNEIWDTNICIMKR